MVGLSTIRKVSLGLLDCGHLAVPVGKCDIPLKALKSWNITCCSPYPSLISVVYPSLSCPPFTYRRVSKGASYLYFKYFCSGSNSLAPPSQPSKIASEVTMGKPVQRQAFQIVVAATNDMGIGKDGKIPWRLPKDMKFFKQVTQETSDAQKKNAVIMGRKTWESIPRRFRPLPGRLNVVLTRKADISSFPDDVKICNSLISALSLLAEEPHLTEVENVFVIGGGEIYREAMELPECSIVHVTEIDCHLPCDTFIPSIDPSIYSVWRASSPMRDNGYCYSFVTYMRTDQFQLPVLANDVIKPAHLNLEPIEQLDVTQTKQAEDQSTVSIDYKMESAVKGWEGQSASLPRFIEQMHEEYQYLNLIEDIIANGAVKGDRTGTGTLSKFGCQMRFNLRKSFPLLTTKRVFWRGVVEELLWFISGSTNAKVLQDKGIHIWDGNASEEYLQSIGLGGREEGDLGPVYGFQWRHFGARYTNMHADYTGQGFDQLAEVIHKIKTVPEDRRIILSAWNPADLSQMALPPCHMFCQFYVADGELSCQMYQRSCDMGLGVPFNIASYSLLTCMVAHVCGLKPGEFIHILGDAHVYSNHVEPLREQLANKPHLFPVLKIESTSTDIDSFTANDFKLIGYQPHKKIAMKMAV